MSRPRRHPLALEALEDRTTPAIIGLEAADVPVSVTAGVDGGGDIAVKADGTGFVVAYESPDASGGGIFFKRYDANWQLVQGPVAVNTFTTNNQQIPSIGMDSAGNFVIAYQSFGQDPGDTAAQGGIYARRFLADGTAVDGAEFRVNTTTVSQQRDPDVGVNAAGQFTIAFRTGVSVNTILAQSYSGITVGGSGTPTTVGGEVTVKLGDGGSNNATAPAVALDSSGNYVVTYQVNGLDGSGFGIFFQRMLQNGTPTGSETLVNTTTAGDQQFPDIALDGSGNFNIVWYTPNVDGSGTAIVMRRFNSAGAAFSGEVQVNTGITLNNQINPHIDFSSAGTGTYLVTWEGEEADGDGIGSDVYFKTYNTAGTVLIGDTRANTSGNNDATEGNAVGGINSAGDFVILFDSGASGTFDTFLRRFGEDADVSFAAASSSGAESANASITVNRTGAAYVLANVANTVTVNNAGGGTATAGTDFTTSFPTTVTFPADGSTSKSLGITITNDTTFEANETINLSIGTVTNGTATGQTTHTYTINDDDTAPTISVNSPSVTEGDGGTVSLTFTISLSAVSGLAVSGNYATANGTATAGSDYVAVGSTAFTIPAGTGSITRTVTVNGDTLFEANETLTLNLSGVTGTTNGTASGTGTITDDDAPANITASSGNNQSATVGTNFASPLVALVKNANNNAVQGVSVVFTAPASGASSVFSTTTNTITVTSNGSGLASTGTFAANNTVGANYLVAAAATGGTNPSTNFTLSNTVPPVSVSVALVSGSSVAENGASLDYQFTRTGSTASALTVNFSNGGTATVADYTPSSTATFDFAAGTIVIPAGASSVTLSLTPVDDRLVEGDETATLTVAASANYEITGSPATGSITDNDTATLGFTTGTSTASESAGTQNVGVILTINFIGTGTIGLGSNLTANLATTGGTATGAGTDYTLPASPAVTFAAGTYATGTATQNAAVTVVDDRQVEGDETAAFGLSIATNIGTQVSVGGTTTHTLTITDNDAGPTANNQSVSTVLNTPKAVTLTATEFSTPPLALTYTVTTSPAHGMLSGTAPNLMYTPATGYTGPDSFQFTASNGVTTSSAATVSITVSPAVPVVTSPVSPTTVNANNFSITGTALANSLVKVYTDLNNNGVVDGGDTVVAQQQLTGGATSFSVSTPLTQDAVNNFVVTATDAFATQSAPADVPTLTEDSTAPALPVVTSPAAPTNANGFTFSITGTAEAGSLVKVFRDVNNNGTIDAGDAVVGTQQLAGGATVFSVSVPLTPSPGNEFVVTATDAAGNESAASDVPSLTGITLSGAVAGPNGLVYALNSDLTVRFVRNGGYPGYTGTVRVAVGDVNNDGTLDVVTATATGVGYVRVFSGVDGSELGAFGMFAGFGDGLYVAVGDIDGDRYADILVGAASGSSQVAGYSGRTGALLGSVAAYPGSTAGVTVAVGDIDGDSFADVILGTASGPGVVTGYSGRTGALLGRLELAPTGGVFVAAGDLDGDGRADVVLATNAGPAEVRVLTTRGAEVRFRPAGRFPGGVYVGVTDFDGNGDREITLGGAPGAGPFLAAYSFPELALLGSLVPFAPGYLGGVAVS